MPGHAWISAGDADRGNSGGNRCRGLCRRYQHAEILLVKLLLWFSDICVGLMRWRDLLVGEGVLVWVGSRALGLSHRGDVP